MNQRIVEIRKSMKLSQTAFANKLGLTQNFVSLVENGSRNFSDRTIRDICRVFNINETWILTGEGDMHDPLSREDEIAQIVVGLTGREQKISTFVLELTKLLCQMDESEIDSFVEAARTISKAADAAEAIRKLEEN